MLKTYGIVLFPNTGTEAYVKSLAAEVGGNLIRLGDGDHVHVSLLHLVLDRYALRQVKERLVSLPLPAPITIQCYEITRRNNGWHCVEIAKSDALLKLQSDVLPLTSLRAADTAFRWRHNATEAQRRAHAQYGYHSVGEAWHPHFTYAKTDTSEVSSTPIVRRGTLTWLALTEIDDETGAARNIHYLRLL